MVILVYSVIRSLTTALVIEAMVNIVTNVKFLQSVIVVMMILFVILHSWKNIFEEDGHKTKIGQIEFDQEELLGKGCLGTSVFRGTFDGRDVAVKVSCFYAEHFKLEHWSQNCYFSECWLIVLH